MEELKINELIQIYQTQVGLVEKIWWYFYSVTLAVLSYPVFGKERIKDTKEVKIVTIGYAVFAFGSALSLWRGHGELYYFAEQVLNRDQSVAINAFPTILVLFFHVAIAVTVIVTIIRIHKIRLQKQDEENVPVTNNKQTA